MLTTERTQEIIKEYGKAEQDSGTPEVQIALFTAHIKHLTEHLKKNRKDFATQRSLQRMVGKRRKLLDYLNKIDVFRYRDIVAKLGLRR